MKSITFPPHCFKTLHFKTLSDECKLVQSLSEIALAKCLSWRFFGLLFPTEDFSIIALFKIILFIPLEGGGGFF